MILLFKLLTTGLPEPYMTRENDSSLAFFVFWTAALGEPVGTASVTMKKELYEKPESEEIFFQYENVILYGTGDDWEEDEE